MTKEERNKLIQDYDAVYNRWLKDESLKREEQDELKREFRRIKLAYFAGLPRQALSRCPYTSSPLVRVFDPWSVDGYWWQENELANYEEPAASPTFAVLTGAVNLNGRPPQGGPRKEAHIGPDIPFVIPRLLQMPSMVAVISCVNMDCGYKACPIAYFSKEKPKPGTLTSTWRRTSYDWRDERNAPCFSYPTDPWDFELEPWIQQGKVLWIEPNDPNLKLLGKADSRCPYVGLPGNRLRQIITADKLRTEPPPAGEVIDPFNE